MLWTLGRWNNSGNPVRADNTVGYSAYMSQTERMPRSPCLMSRDDSALLVVDVQGKLITMIPGHQRIIWNIRRLIDGAKSLDISVAGTEQYPQGLGPTTPELAERLGQIPAKMTFSCGGCPEIFQGFRDRGIYKILVVGIEGHVCVQQTVLDLLGDGFRVYLAVDAVGSRFDIDYQTALRRMDSAGATLTTTESALFEWCDVAGTPEFKQISALVREKPPEHKSELTND
jgi:nicotinamidase-related amidase